MSFQIKKSELFIRTISSIIMIFIATLLIGAGGIVFEVSLVLLSIFFVWEILGFGDETKYYRKLLAFSFAILFAIYLWLDPLISFIIVFVFLLFYKFIVKPNNFNKRAVYLIIILFSLGAMSSLRTDIGLIQTLWVISCVVASDVGGYFFGRSFGGPKLWSKISPKKTWSGILGGWFLAFLLTYLFVYCFNQITHIYLYWSVFIAISSQVGDLYESALKRSAGIKDSSNLIPGHGGFLDRFDGMIGAFFAIFIIELFQINYWVY
ncbi:phosphatidate cytidylyltransferase [Amylibacter sp.]|nr:phosphatidate cytidylyltransferase [Amylibacter sp.]